MVTACPLSFALILVVNGQVYAAPFVCRFVLNCSLDIHTTSCLVIKLGGRGFGAPMSLFPSPCRKESRHPLMGDIAPIPLAPTPRQCSTWTLEEDRRSPMIHIVGGDGSALSLSIL